MSNQPIELERIINAPISKVWKAITDKNEMKNWYFDLAEYKAEKGFKFQFHGRTGTRQTIFASLRDNGSNTSKETYLQFAIRRIFR